MPESDSFWNFYWETRLQGMETLGKREAVLAGSRLIRRLYQERGRALRVLEPGCGEGQVVGALLEAHAQMCAGNCVVGVDYNPRSLARCRKDYPGWQFSEGDFTSPDVLDGLGQYDLLLLVNALHEVFSRDMLNQRTTPAGGIEAARQRTAQAFTRLAGCINQGGWLLLFDGLEPPGDPDEILTIRFVDRQARAGFETFARQYQPLKINYQPTGDPLRVRLPRRAFARYITKSIFLGKALWNSEQLESYQYFNEEDFRAACQRDGLRIHELRTLTVNTAKWQRIVIPEGFAFPDEHIMILAQKE